MSIFAMNYLNDISEYDQSLVDFNEKGVIALKRKSQKARTKNRILKHQTFAKYKLQSGDNSISRTQNKIIQDAITHQKSEKNDFGFQFIKVYQSKFNNKSSMEGFSHNCSDQEEQLAKDKDPIKEDILDPKEELYLKVIKRREEKLKHVQKKHYFFDHSRV